MGQIQHEVLVKDLDVGVENQFNVDDNYLKHLFTVHSFKGRETNLNNVFKMMRNFTTITGREIAMEYYSSFNKSPAKRFRVPSYTLAVPEIGDQVSVSKPSMTGKEKTGNWRKNDENFYLNTLHIHTHPGWSVLPSENDLDNSLTRSKDWFYGIKGKGFNVDGSPIDVILSSDENSTLFYRCNGNLQAFYDFKKEYLENKIYDTNEGVNLMNSSGAFNACYISEDNKSRRISKDNLEKITDTFCPLNFKVTRII